MHDVYCIFRRERTTTTAFADDTDFLDLDDHLTPPSELYAGSGGKPPLTFHMDTKSHKKKSVTFKQEIVWVARPPVGCVLYIHIMYINAHTFLFLRRHTLFFIMFFCVFWVYFCVYLCRSSTGLHQSLLVTESVQDTGTEWLEYVDPNEPRYCLCNQVSVITFKSSGSMHWCNNYVTIFVCIPLYTM